MAIFMRVLPFFIMMFLLPLNAQAQLAGWASSDNAQGKLISTVNGVGDKDTLEALFHLRLNKGWHTYWHNPGEAGLPPRFNWEGSTNVADVVVHYPAPTRFDEVGLQVFGYDGEVMFPLEIKPETPGEAISLKLKTDLLVCHDICVPEVLKMSLDIQAGAATDSSEAALMDLANRKLPGESDAGLKIENVIAGPDALVVTGFSQRGFDKADVFVEADDLVITALPEVIVDPKEPRQAMLKISKPFDVEDLAAAVKGKMLKITLSDGQRAVEGTFPF